MKHREQKAAFAAFVAALVDMWAARRPRVSTRRQRRPRMPPPAACPVHGEPALRSRYGKAWYPCGCRFKHARLGEAKP